MQFPLTPTWKSRTIAVFVSFVLAWLPFGLAMAAGNSQQSPNPIGDDIEQGASAGQQVGNEAVSVDQVFQQSGDDTYSYSSDGEDKTIRMEELFPGSKDRIDTDGQKQLYGGDNKEMMKQGRKRNEALDGDRNTPEGNAHDVLRESSQQSSPDFENSPLGQTAKDSYGNGEIVGDSFQGCETETGVTTVERSRQVEELHQCVRTIDKTKTCTLEHDYSAAIVKPHSGPWNTKPCGRGCQLIWIGKVGDNYWSGYCTEYSQQTEFEVVSPGAIKSAKLIRAKWDDYMQVYVGEPGGNYEKVWQGPYGKFPEKRTRTVSGRGGEREITYYTEPCELSTSWDKNPGVDLTPYFKGVDPGDVVRFKVRVSVAGKGEGYGRIRIRYDTDDAITQDTWYPQECIEAARGLDDGVAYGDVRCNEKPQEKSSGCVVLDGFTICERDLKDSPVSSLSPLCKEATVDVTYAAGGGNGESIDSCKQYEEDPNCGFVSSECTKGNEGDESGECYSRTETWDCGSTVTWEEQLAETQYQCGDAVRCMGDECASPSNQTSGSFQKAATMLEAADFMMIDAECQNSEDTTENIDLENCEVFKGEPGECMMALGSYKNCCESPGGPSLKDYMALLQAAQKLDQATGITQAILETSGGQALQGAWETVANAADQVWSSVTQSFSSAFNSIAGNTTQNLSTEVFAEGFKQTLIDVTAEWVGKIFGTAAKNALFSGTAAGQTTQLGGQGAWAGNLIAGVMYVYMIYVIVKAVLNMIYKCEEDDMKVAAKIQLKSCHKVGSYCSQDLFGSCTEEQQVYCCFNSPLSRIMQEEVKKQLGDLGWGNPKEPQCGGINPNRLSEIDWDKVDLSEWTAILADTGNLPQASSMDIESLTGDGNYLSKGSGGERPNAEVRTEDRVDAADFDETHEQATDELHGMYPPEDQDGDESTTGETGDSGSADGSAGDSTQSSRSSDENLWGDTSQ